LFQNYKSSVVIFQLALSDGKRTRRHNSEHTDIVRVEKNLGDRESLIAHVHNVLFTWRGCVLGSFWRWHSIRTRLDVAPRIERSKVRETILLNDRVLFR
jgi:hypothetical protein